MRRGLLLLSVVLLAGTRSTGAAGGFTNGQAASVVLGQLDFVTKTAGTSATTLRTPGAVALDTAANVWVADVLNRRVVRFDAPSTTGKAASIVLGQPNFISNTQNNGGRTASSLSDPLALAVDGGGSLWVADGGANGRILRYSPPFTNFMAASLVLGVPSFTAVTSGPSQTSVGRPGGGGPHGLAFDAIGNLWVADSDNNRVLRFNAPFTTGQAASIVLGQSNFTANAAPATPTASSLNQPTSVAVDSSGSVWIADSTNNRVLRFSPPFSNGQAASLVIGQSGFTSKSTPSAPTATSLRIPSGVSFDSSGSLWIVDSQERRILGYDPPFANGQAAATVIGQADFVSNAAADPPTANSLLIGMAPVAFAGRRLWAGDPFNNRVLAYDPRGGGRGRGGKQPPKQEALDPMSPEDFPMEVTAEWRCAESIAGVCLRQEIVRICVGGQCFSPLPPPGPPIPAKRYVGGGVAAGAALGLLGGVLLGRRRRRP